MDLFELPRWVLELAFVTYVLVVSMFIVLERRRPTATLALVLALVFLPVVGLLVYLLFSRNRVRRRRKKRARRPVNPFEGTRHLANLATLPADMPPLQRGLVRLALKSAAAPLRRADVVQLLLTARDSFEAVKESIEAAQRTIHLEFYIWRDDPTGRRIVELLTARAKAGIKVRVLYDHLGSLGLPRSHFAPLVEAGGEIAIFGRLRVPVRLGRIRLNFRNHRKLMTIDGRVGFMGGLNVGDEYFGNAVDIARWRDLWMRMEGDAVIGLEAIFLEDWLSTTGQVIDLEGVQPREASGIDARRPPVRRPPRWRKGRASAQQLARANPFAALPDRPMSSAGPLVQVIPSGPDIPVASSIAAQFSAAISSAQQRAWIATPYFIPDEPLTLILRTAALRGVDVRILVPNPRKNDQRLVALASRSYYDELLEVGCRVFEYEPGMLHAKYLIVDDVSAIGSANMDIRSFHINYEVTAMFYDVRVTAMLADLFVNDLGQAKEITPQLRTNLPLPQRVAESFARVCSPLL